MRGVGVTVQLLKSLCPPHLLSNRVLIEHRFFVSTVKSMAVNCTRDGFGHYDIILRPDRIINRLVKEGILPQDANVGRLQLGNLKRIGVGVPLSTLIEYEHEIKNYLEDHMNMDNVDEAYRVLCQGVVLAIFNGYVEPESPVLANIANFVHVLPAPMQQQLLTQREHAEKLFTGCN